MATRTKQDNHASPAEQTTTQRTAGRSAPRPAENRQRQAAISRTTSESTVELVLDLDGSGRAEIDTGVGFYDHMLTALAKHALVDLTVKARGDLPVDVHHTVEDVAIVLGEALQQALGDKTGIARFGDALVPLDEALAQAVVDLSGRGYCVCTGEPPGQAYHLIGGHFTGSLTQHVFETLALRSGICLHVRLLAGRDPHHIVEAQFKAVARALRQAVAYDPRVVGIPSTKGAL
ncbi:MAG: imidazoleglycerol-phosphate dehydratase HisB [Bifidobacteriaceae bacterium]|nr:imidazoleglycerol-phosphate dehydratase HisB [Bifidobacteriaceae bacterium]